MRMALIIMPFASLGMPSARADPARRCHAPPAGVYPTDFVRHSPYIDNPAAHQLDLAPQDFNALTYPFDKAGLREVAYQFIDRRADHARLDGWLDRLDRPLAPEDLGPAARPDLAWLVERGLVFEDDGRYLSLMVNG